MTARHDAFQGRAFPGRASRARPSQRRSKHRAPKRVTSGLPTRSARHRAGATTFGFRPSASLHRSAPRGPSRRRRLSFGALAGFTVVAASSGLAAILATGAYAAPRAELHPTTPGAYLLQSQEVRERQQVRATALEAAAEKRAATARRAAAAAAQQAARRESASRAQQRAALAAVSFRGLASWYGPGFDGHRTASGAIYDEDALTAASRTLPLGTRLQVCHGGACVTVLINDRGPAPRSRVLDLSRAAAKDIGIYSAGVGEVTATVVG